MSDQNTPSNQDADVQDIVRLLDEAVRDIQPSASLLSQLASLAEDSDRGPGRRSIFGHKRTDRRPRLLAVAAVVAVVIGGGAVARVVSERSDTVELETVDEPDRPETVTETTRPAETDTETDTDAGRLEVGAQPNLIPDQDRWVAVELIRSPASPGQPTSGIWAWDTEQGLVILSTSPTATRQSLPPDEAEVETLHNRVTMVWDEGPDRVSLQGIDTGRAALRATAMDLRREGDDWLLDEATVLAAESASISASADSRQINYAPIDRPLAMDAIISGSTRVGSIGSLFSELHEASSLGPVVSTTIGGRPGYLIEGPLAAYALAAGDGWVSSWQSFTPGVGLADFISSISTVSDAELEASLLAGEQAKLEAIAGAADAVDSSTAYIAELPRYILPEPWTPEWVTDMGLWTPEQRSQRLALFGADAGGSVSTRVWAQGFHTVGRTDRLAVPEVVLEVWELPADAAEEEFWPLEGDNSAQPYTLAGIEGHIRQDDVHGRWQIVVSGDGHVITIRALSMERDELRAFADTLRPRSEGFSRGFGTEGEFEIVFEEAGPEDRGLGAVTSWVASWAGPDGTATVAVAEMSLAGLHQRLFITGGVPGTVLELIDDDDGRFTFRHVLDNVALEESGIILDEPDRSSVSVYDVSTGLLLDVSRAGGDQDVVDLLDELIEVDIETWRTLVEPVNSDPLRPR